MAEHKLKTDEQIINEFAPLIPTKILKERFARLKEPRAGSIFTQSEEIAQEWLLRSMLGEASEQTKDIPERLNMHRKYGGVEFKRWSEMEAENKQLKAKVEAVNKIFAELWKHNILGNVTVFESTFKQLQALLSQDLGVKQE
jgi:hypothetical protein